MNELFDDGINQFVAPAKSAGRKSLSERNI